MDDIFMARLKAKLEQHALAREELKRRPMGEYELVKVVLDSNGTIIEDCLQLMGRFWQRTKPFWLDKTANEHLKILEGLIAVDRKALDIFFKKCADTSIENQVKNHFDNYDAKVRDELALLVSERRQEIRGDIRQWLFSFCVPVLCSVLTIVFADRAREMFKEIQQTRAQVAELSKTGLISSHLILDGNDRWGGAPIHKAAAYDRLREIEDQLRIYYPDIRDEIKRTLAQTNRDSERFWVEYSKLSGDKQQEAYVKQQITRHRGF